MNEVYRFEVEIEGDVYSKETFPVYDENSRALVGGFTLRAGENILGFISGVGHSAAIFVSTGENFYFTPKEDKNGKVAYGLISELPISPLSVNVNVDKTGGSAFYE